MFTLRAKFWLNAYIGSDPTPDKVKGTLSHCRGVLSSKNPPCISLNISFSKKKMICISLCCIVASPFQNVSFLSNRVDCVLNIVQ